MFKKNFKKTNLISFLSSWVSPYTFWSDDGLQEKSPLMIMSFIPYLTQIFCLIAIYLRNEFGDRPTFETAPFMHCFEEEDFFNTNYSTPENGSCWRTVYSLDQSMTSRDFRVCGVDEAPEYHFSYFWGIPAFILVHVSLAATLCLRRLKKNSALFKCSENCMHPFKRLIGKLGCEYKPIFSQFLSIVKYTWQYLKNKFVTKQEEMIGENDTNEYAMHKACKENNTGWLCFWALLGGHWDASNKAKETVLFLFLDRLESGQIEWEQCNWLVKRVLARSCDQDGGSVLLYAANNGFIRSTKILIDWGVDVNITNIDNGSTPLHLAINRQKLKAAELLIEGGASVNATTYGLQTSLHLAVLKGDLNLVSLCTDAKGAKINAQSITGLTPLHMAAVLGKYFILRLLLHCGAGMF